MSAVRFVRPAAIALGLSFLVAAATAARADSIDGNWCDGKGRQLSIEGTTIFTPGGHRAQGSYARHRFEYTTPAAEEDAGSAVSLLLVNEMTIRATTGQRPDSAIWTRCEKVS